MEAKSCELTIVANLETNFVDHHIQFNSSLVSHRPFVTSSPTGPLRTVVGHVTTASPLTLTDRGSWSEEMEKGKREDFLLLLFYSVFVWLRNLEVVHAGYFPSRLTAMLVTSRMEGGKKQNGIGRCSVFG